MKQNYVLEKYFMKYLTDVRGLSRSSIGHYTQALRKISSLLVEAGKIEESIYEVLDISVLECLRAYLYGDPKFVDLDERGHRMYSAGFNNYLRFAFGEDYRSLKTSIEIFDVEMQATGQAERMITYAKRSTIIKNQVIEAAGFKCEINAAHNTFISKSSGQQYMEGHHAIPLKKQSKFVNSLDVYANVICLCPVCHRLLHFGQDRERSILLNQIYYERGERLAKSGIRISKSDFIDIAL